MNTNFSWNWSILFISSFPSPGLGTQLYRKPRLRVIQTADGASLCKCVPEPGLGNGEKTGNIFSLLTILKTYPCIGPMPVKSPDEFINKETPICFSNY